MTIQRGEVWWADLDVPEDSEPGYRRPVLVVQDDMFNRSAVATVIVLSLTSNLRHARVAGNVHVSRKVSRLRSDSIVNASQLATISKSRLEERVSVLPAALMAEVDAGLKLVLGLDVE